jgi:hypothetical protein
MKTKHPTTLVNLLKIRAQTQLHQLACIFLVDGEIEETKLTYSELDQPASALLLPKQKSKVAAGEHAPLLYLSIYLSIYLSGWTGRYCRIFLVVFMSVSLPYQLILPAILFLE